MSLIKTSFYSLLSTSVSLLAKLVTNKIAAVYLGTSGMFVLGQLKDFISLSKVAGSLGTDTGVVKYTAEFEDSEKLDPFLKSAFKIQLIAATIVCILTLVFNDRLSNYLFSDSKFANALILIGFSFIPLTIHGFFMSVINGHRKIKSYVMINVIATIITSLVTIVMVISYNILGAIYGIALNQIIIVLFSLIFIKNKRLLPTNIFKSKILAFDFKNLTKFSVMAIVAPVCMLGATFFTRLFLNSNLGQDYAGSWEGMWRISAMYMMFITTTFQFYLIPTFSKLKGLKLRKEIFKVWSLSVPSVLVITMTTYLLKDFIIPLLFSEEFLLINTIILFHLLGDTIKINSWVLGKLLVSKANTKVFIFFQIGWAAVFCSLTVVLVNYYGFKGVSIAYFLSYCLHFLAMNLYFRKLLWVKINRLD